MGSGVSRDQDCAEHEGEPLVLNSVESIGSQPMASDATPPVGQAGYVSPEQIAAAKVAVREVGVAAEKELRLNRKDSRRRSRLVMVGASGTRLYGLSRQR